MKKAWMIRVLLLVLYCIPFVFLSVKGDAVFRTMLFYGIMIISFGLLCWGALKTDNTAVIFIGNILSFASSYLTAQWSGLEPMGEYFKPFTSYSLISSISLIGMVFHVIIVWIYGAKKKKTGSR